MVEESVHLPGEAPGECFYEMDRECLRARLDAIRVMCIHASIQSTDRPFRFAVHDIEAIVKEGRIPAYVIEYLERESTGNTE